MVQSDMPQSNMLEWRIIGWLQMEYTPEELDEDQMERFENLIESWVEAYENDLPPASGRHHRPVPRKAEPDW